MEKLAQMKDPIQLPLPSEMNPTTTVSTKVPGPLEKSSPNFNYVDFRSLALLPLQIDARQANEVDSIEKIREHRLMGDDSKDSKFQTILFHKQ